MPVIGFLHPASADTVVNFVVGFRRGLSETAARLRGFDWGVRINRAILWPRPGQDRRQ